MFQSTFNNQFNKHFNKNLNQKENHKEGRPTLNVAKEIIESSLDVSITL
jgi:hypothetical protein